MSRLLLSILVIVGLAAPAFAENKTDWRFGGDAFIGGNAVELSGDPVEDLFAAGRRVRVATEVRGSAHMAGQRLAVDARIGRNLYAAGQSIDIAAPVAGNVTVTGQTVTLREPVSGNLRAAGQDVAIEAPIAGSAILGGQEVRIDAAIGGDLALGAQDVTWGDSATVGGEIHVYTDDPDSIEVPARVAEASRVTFHEVREFDEARGMPGMEPPGLWQRLRGWLGGVIAVGLLGTLIGWLAPGTLAALRTRAISRPVFTGLVGAVGLSALIGSVALLAMTGFGIVLIPVSLIAAVLLAILGYVIGAYALGVWITGVAGRGEPRSIGDRAIAAFTGAAIGALVGLIPWIGWLAVMAIFLVGGGALVARMIRLDREDLAV